MGAACPTRREEQGAANVCDANLTLRSRRKFVEQSLLGVELDELHGAEEQEGAAHQHGGSDGSLFAAAKAAELGQCLHDFDGFFIGGLAELIDRGGRHLHEQGPEATMPGPGCSICWLS